MAIVTGASSGIGKATALRLNDEGYQVFAGARRVEKMNDLKQAGILVHQLDVTKQDSNRAFVDFVEANATEIDIIVNSAGYGSQGALEDVDPAEAKNQFDVNVFGLMALTQMILPIMRHQHSGKIINISSVGGQMYSPLAGWYYASKHALEALSDTLRMEVKPFGIDVIIIEPGGTKTEWGSVAMDKLKAQTPANSAYHDLVEAYEAGGFSGFTTTPEEIAALIMRAINARRPKTRYQPNFGMKMLVIMARKLSYKQFDKVMGRQMRGLTKH
ncbi:oxidoreductase [Secundilactobacillus silagei]|uniref:oxidoreductase n=1 Tax=Secundilactobacillus silagei TaxID=1293415 RepID=UPI0006D24D09|nr:oxidoreductase [Secundilactobacillus silagei]